SRDEVYGDNQIGPPGGKACFSAVIALLGLCEAGELGEEAFNTHAFAPGLVAAKLEAFGHTVLVAEAEVYEDNSLVVVLSQQ
ncbi:hypothetical protein OFM21_32925, partial [Escherichia coli]|nr:hypothetical protein [Escherichia coli]